MFCRCGSALPRPASLLHVLECRLASKSRLCTRLHTLHHDLQSSPAQPMSVAHLLRAC